MSFGVTLNPEQGENGGRSGTGTEETESAYALNSEGQHAMEEKQINMIFISRLSYWVLLAFLVIHKD